MAKTPTKTATKAAPKAAPTPKATASSAPSVDKVAEDALEKLKALDLDHQLQADIQWCLGSYRADGNPAGLYEMIDKAISVFNVEKEKKTKGVTAKFVTDLEKGLKGR